MIYPGEDWITRDSSGMIMPWYVRPFLEKLDAIDLSDKVIFEYGSGNSTLWYKARGAEVWSVDSSPYWSEKTGAYYTEEKEEYLAYIKNRNYDIIVIDGEWRDECFIHAMTWLKRDGFIIIDNWEQGSVEPNDWTITKETIKDFGLRIEVYKEPTHPDWATAIISL